MANLNKVLQNGAVLEGSMGSWDEGMALYKAVAREIDGIKLDFGGDLKGLFEGNMTQETVDTVKSAVARLTASDAIQGALWACMARCTYNKQKVTKDLFEDEKIREDYLPVAKEVMVFNLGPFSRGLASMFPDLLAAIGRSRGSG